MSSCQGMEERLNDYVDDLLSGADRQDLERHLQSCAECRGTLDGLRSLRKEAASLPKSLRPPRDLWPGIEASLPGGKPAARPEAIPIRRGPRGWPWRAALAAAAVVLVAVTAGITRWLTQSGGGRPEPVGVAGVERDSPALASFRAAETEYQSATDELLRVLDERRHELSPETVALVEENLRIINEAIRQAREALESEPNVPGNGHLFTSLYRRKITLLEQVVRLPQQG